MEQVGQSDKLHVVGREGCPQCTVMCAVLGDRGIPYRYTKLDDPEERSAQLARVGSNTFPLVFCGNEYVGNTGFATWVMAKFEEGCDAELSDVLAAWKERVSVSRK